MKPAQTNAGVTGIIQFVALAVSLSVHTHIASAAQESDLPNSFISSPESVVTATKNNGNGNNQMICSTPGCVRAASQISKNMNPDVKPCDDFYEFACGGFEESTTISDDQFSVSLSSELSDVLLEQLKTAFEEPSGPDEQRPFLLAKNLYKSCMDTSTIEKRGLEPLQKILRTLGTWPVIEGDKWEEGQFDWPTSIYRFRNYGFSTDYLITFNVNIDARNSMKNIITLDQAWLGISREYLSQGMEDEVVKAYFEYMVNVAVILGADEERASQELKESLEFEIQLATISVPDDEPQDPAFLYNPMTIAELDEQFPIVDWKEYINKLLPPHLNVHNTEIVLVTVPSFFSDLVELLRTTPKRVQANYMMWSIARDSIKFLTHDLRDIEFNFISVLTGETERKIRWKECADVVANRLSISTGALYVRKYFPKDAKKSAVEIASDIKKEFTEILKKVDWMDEKTKQIALAKAASFSYFIGYPDELLDAKKLEQFYSGLKLRDNDYLGDILEVTLFDKSYLFSQLGKPVNKSDWVSHGSVAAVNAFYSPIENSIQIPAGMLQGVYSVNDRPRSMSYGAVGSLIGHDTTYGFDFIGRQFGEDGSPGNWWTLETENNYLKKAEHVMNQYDNYFEESVGLNLNGTNTLEENIADIGGVSMAYKAYKKWVKKNGREPGLPSLDFTPEQIFWISYANTRCIKYRPEELESVILADIHSPGKFRVIGPLSDSVEFSADFGCSVGSPMNPEQKNSVW